MYHVLVKRLLAVIMVSVISQLGFAIAMKNIREMTALVIYFSSISQKSLVTSRFFFVELKCPGDCSNAGNCDTSTGQCTCDSGRHGLDCSSR